MKFPKSLPLLALVLLLVTACSEENKIMLFNGKNLDNWEMVLFDSTAIPGEVFQVVDHKLRISGEPYGYIITGEAYSNYLLHLEWRWPEQPANSGVFLHAQGINPSGWPISIEAQLANSRAGDLIFVGTGTGAHTRDSIYITLPGMQRSARVEKIRESTENPAGEWNTYELTCKGDMLEVRVNRILQNIVDDATISSGRIALQSEGGSIEFRNIYLVPLEIDW